MSGSLNNNMIIARIKHGVLQFAGTLDNDGKVRTRIISNTTPAKGEPDIGIVERQRVRGAIVCHLARAGSYYN